MPDAQSGRKCTQTPVVHCNPTACAGPVHHKSPALTGPLPVRMPHAQGARECTHALAMHCNCAGQCMSLLRSLGHCLPELLLSSGRFEQAVAMPALAQTASSLGAPARLSKSSQVPAVYTAAAAALLVWIRMRPMQVHAPCLLIAIWFQLPCTLRCHCSW